MSYKLAGVIWNDDGTMATKKLTLQELELLNTASAYNGEQYKAICGRAALELIEYKKIEEELGIDLITLFKAFRNGVWLKQGDNVVFHKPYNGGIVEGLSYFRRLVEPQWTQNYGKTWALTKEELL